MVISEEYAKNININLNLGEGKSIGLTSKFDSNQTMKLTGKRKAQIIVAIDSKSHKKDKDGFHFHGKLTEPRLSLNGWIYFPQELAPQDGKTVPLTIDHEEAFTMDPKIRGSLKLAFDEDTWDLNYEAVTKDKEAIAGIESGKYNSISMTAEWEDEDKIRGWLVPKGVTTTYGSLVENPGITSATVKTDAFVQCCDGIYPLQKCDSKILHNLKDFKKKPTPKKDSVVKSSHKKKNSKSDHNMSKNDNEETLAEVLVEAIAEQGEESASEEEMKEQIANELEIHENVVESILNGDEKATDEFLAAFAKVTGLDESRLDAFKSDEEEEEEEEESDEEEEEEEEEDDDPPKKKDTKSKKDTKTKSKKDSKPKKAVSKKVIIKADGKPQEIVVKVDTSDITNLFEKHLTHLDSIVTKKKTKGKTDSKILTKKEQRTKFYDSVTESLRKFQALKMDWIGDQLKGQGIGLDAIGLTEVGTAAGAQWLEDITILPAGLQASLRSTCEVVQIQRGAKEVHFTLISTPTPVNGSAPTVPGDVSQTITDIVATPIERVLKQRVTDQAARNTSVNLGSAIATTFKNAEVLDEDEKILTELDGLTVGNLAGDFIQGQSTEGEITTSDIFVSGLLRKAKRALLRQGWEEAAIPGRAVCVMSPEQMEQLMGDTTIQRFIEWVSDGTALKTGVIPRLHGIDLLVSTKVTTGLGTPITVITHRAFVYIRDVSVGLGFTKDLEIESARYVEERATTMVASYELAAKNKSIVSVVRLVTYGSGA